MLSWKNAYIKINSFHEAFLSNNFCGWKCMVPLLREDDWRVFLCDLLTVTYENAKHLGIVIKLNLHTLDKS